jgi:hypothetical protein
MRIHRIFSQLGTNVLTSHRAMVRITSQMNGPSRAARK